MTSLIRKVYPKTTPIPHTDPRSTGIEFDGAAKSNAKTRKRTAVHLTKCFNEKADGVEKELTSYLNDTYSEHLAWFFPDVTSEIACALKMTEDSIARTKQDKVEHEQTRKHWQEVEWQATDIFEGTEEVEAVLDQEVV